VADIDYGEYYIDMLEHIKAAADVEGRLIELEYLEFILGLLSDAGEFDDYTIVEDGRDGAGRWIVDGYSYDENNYTLSLFVTLLSTSDELLPLSRREAEQAIGKISAFLDVCLSQDLRSILEPASSCYQAAAFIRDNWKDVSRVNLLVISNRPSVDFRKNIVFDDVDGRASTVHLWDLKRIYKLESSRAEREEMYIDLSDSPVPCLIAHKEDGGGQSILAVVSGDILVDLYGKWGSRLLEQNVRSFLQARGKVNKGIRSTILNDSSNFFAYNNGLTTIAEGVDTREVDGQKSIVGLKNMQIVNGAQTTASIYSTFFKDKADMSNISVQMKLTVLPNFESSGLVSKISRFANSQNKVSDADLFSNHPFHVRIEEFSRRIWVPVRSDQTSQTHWFYERARGQYLDAQAFMSKSAKMKFLKINPRSQLLTKTDVAKVMNSWDCLPHEVSKGAQKNFAKFAERIDKEWVKGDLGFNENYYRKLISRAYIFKSLEKAVLKAKWYSGYRANIVTYTIARLGHEIQSKSLVLNYDSLWRSSAIPVIISQILILLAESVNEVLQDDARPIGNISEYAKRAFLWDTVKNVECNIQGLEEFLIDVEESKLREKDSKGIQKEDDGIQVQAKVLGMNKSIWSQVERCLHEDDAATPSLVGILKAAKSPKGLPTEKQSKVLVKLLNRYESRLG